MKKTLLFFVLIGQVLLAQQVKIQSITMIQVAEPSSFYYPIFSPSGDYLLLTSENYVGLKQYSLVDKSLKTITADAGAGYGVQISADGNTIAYKKTLFVNSLRHNSLISYSRVTGKRVQLVSPTRESISTTFSANKPQFVKGKTLVRNNVASAEISPLVCIEDQKMVLYAGNARSVITPNGMAASYIWPAISPDRKSIVYAVAGKGTFVCRIDGSNVISLGKLNAPVWINNQWLVGMDDKDNGEKLLSSTLIAVTVNGKVRQVLSTPAGVNAMYPAASVDGSKIAFNTDKGELYLLNIQIK